VDRAEPLFKQWLASLLLARLRGFDPLDNFFHRASR
jgi:hypothetical protein